MKRFLEVCYWVDEWETYVLTAGGVVVGLVASLTTISFLVPSLALLALAGMGAFGRRSRKKLIGKRIDALVDECRDDVDVKRELEVAALAMRLMAPWRVSVYVLDDELWRLASRTSSYAPYARPGRTAIPMGQGCLHWAYYFQGTDELTNLPDPDKDPEGYAQMMRSRRIDQATIAAMRMKSRAYAAKAVRLAFADRKSITLAVVVESEKPNGLDPRLVDAKLSDDWMSTAAKLLALEPPLDQLSSQARADQVLTA